MYAHYFISAQIYFEHTSFFLLRKPKTIVLAGGDNQPQLSLLSKFESLKQEDPNRQQQDLRLFSNSLRSKISVVLISKLPNGISFSEGTLEEELAKTSETLRNLSVLAENGIPRVSPSEVEAVVAEMTGIPLGKIQAQEKDRLLGIESRLEERVKGQNKEITTL